MVACEVQERIKEVDNSKNCPFHKDLCMVGGPGCVGADWKNCSEYRAHVTMWRRLLIFRKIK
jgi:hypothetical protein